MKQQKNAAMLLVYLFFLLAGKLAFAQASNELNFKPGEDWKDDNGVSINAHGGGMIFYKKRYYWFGEHKIGGKIGNTAQVGVHCYSSANLYNWKDEGIALKVLEDTTSDIQKGCILERPKVIYNAKTKKFVMWFHIEIKNKGYAYAHAGIAIAPVVTGPYTFVKSVRSNPGFWPQNVLPVHKLPVSEKVKKTYFPGGGFPGNIDSLNILGKFFHDGQMIRDMNLFVDDDGKAYQVYASEYNATLQIAELSDDYLSYTGKYCRAFVGRFMEAPAMMKRNGLYYLIMSGTTGWKPNPARSAMARSIWGPWTETGNPCTGSDSLTTYHSQGTYILPVVGKKDSFIYMGDRWNPENPIDGRYVWLPILFKKNQLILPWYPVWSLNVFDGQN